MQSGAVVGWVCEHDSSVVGFCSGDTASGEVLVLAVLPDFERKGIGKRLLAHVVDGLRAKGHGRLWLAASADAASRAHGFYRARGWRPTGERDAQGDEVLVLESGWISAPRESILRCDEGCASAGAPCIFP